MEYKILTPDLMKFLETVKYTPAVAAIVQIFIETNLKVIPEYLLSDFPAEVFEALEKQFIAKTDAGFVLTKRATAVLKVVLASRSH